MRGGSVRVTDEEIRVQELIDEVRSEEAGAIVLFLGTPRRRSRGREVEYLEYEAYPEMAERKMREIAEQLTASCREVDPTSTNEAIELAHAADVVEGEIVLPPGT